MTLALYGKSRKRQGLLVLLALFAVLAAAFGGFAWRNAANALSGAIYTTTSNGQIVNQNLFANKSDVYLNGGPTNDPQCTNPGLPEGDYYFQVTVPSGAVLSSDAIKFRQVHVGATGRMTGVSGDGNHAVASQASPCGSLGVQLMPYDDTTNPGGEYSVNIYPKTCVDGATTVEQRAQTNPRVDLAGLSCETKNDNFKVNAATGIIIIRKDTKNPETDPQDFAFTTSGTGLSNFTLDDDSDPTYPNTTPGFSGLSAGSYTVTETAVSGWVLTGIQCTGDLDGGNQISTGNRQVIIDLDGGETITCTFTNQRKPKLTVNKVCDPANDTGKFDVQISGTTYKDDALCGQGTGKVELDPGSYTVSEVAGTGTNLSNYITTIGGDCAANGAVTLAYGDDKTCTITNVRRGTIIIVKDANPEGAQTFAFTGSLGAFGINDDGNNFDGDADSQTFQGLTPGQYTVTETVPGGWSLESIDCVDPTQNSSGNGNTATINLAAGETVTCTFHNKETGTIIIEKDADPARTTDSFGFTGGLGSFTLQGQKDWGPPFGLGNDSQTFQVASGQYDVTETVPDHWKLTAISCTDGSQWDLQTATAHIELDPGETVRCIFFNEAEGGIVINKVDLTLPGDLTKNMPWNFTVTGPPGATPTIGSGGGQVIIGSLPFGTYDVTEDDNHAPKFCPELPNIDQQGYYTSVSAPADTTIDEPGEVLTWTFTNQPCPVELAAPNLSVRKIIDYNGNGVNDGSDFFANGWDITVTCGATVLNGTTGDDGLGNVFFLGTPTGTCTVAETTQAGYSSTVKFAKHDSGSNTTGTGSSTTITQDLNDNNAVVFFNRPVVSIRVRKLTTENGGPQTPANGWTFTLTGTGACGIAPQAGTTAINGEVVFSNLPAAVDGCSYSVAETTQAGWTLLSANPQAANPSAPGQQVTLTFVNGRTTVCTNCFIPTPPPPTPTPPTPTATTPPPTATPTEVATVLGEKTPGPPSTGSGRGVGGSASINLAIALLGLMAMSGGFALIALGRRR